MIAIDDIENRGGIGFRHLIEDGLAIVKRESDITNARRNTVLNELSDLFGAASIGSIAGAESEGFFVPGDAAAARSYYFIEQHVSSPKGADLPRKLDVAQKVLGQIKDEKRVRALDRNLVAEVLQDVLEHLRVQSGSIMPTEPGEIRRQE